MATTDRNYADMVNPYVRAEEEARLMGFRHGVGVGIFATVMVLAFAFAMFFYSLEARGAAAELRYQPTRAPIRASDLEARITVCQQDASSRKWLCYSVL